MMENKSRILAALQKHKKKKWFFSPIWLASGVTLCGSCCLLQEWRNKSPKVKLFCAEPQRRAPWVNVGTDRWLLRQRLRRASHSCTSSSFNSRDIFKRKLAGAWNLYSHLLSAHWANRSESTAYVPTRSQTQQSMWGRKKRERERERNLVPLKGSAKSARTGWTTLSARRPQRAWTRQRCCCAHAGLQ